MKRWRKVKKTDFVLTFAHKELFQLRANWSHRISKAFVLVDLFIFPLYFIGYTTIPPFLSLLSQFLIKASITITSPHPFHHLGPSMSPFSLMYQTKCMNTSLKLWNSTLTACTSLITTWIWLVCWLIKYAFYLNEVNTERYYTSTSICATFTWSGLFFFPVAKSFSSHTHF